jgi:8-oxo-dGTP pyrophosphatase MutT (NUDIX family)
VKWLVHGERSLYESDWVCLRLVDVELPGGPRFDHHAVRIPHDAAAVVVVDPDRGVLLIWRHRFLPDVWGWEIPGGRIDPGETPVEAAAREAFEETGWRPGPLRPLVSFHPVSGISDWLFHVFIADGAEYVGEPESVFETDRVEWVSLDRLRELIRAGEIRDGYSLVGLLRYLTL